MAGVGVWLGGYLANGGGKSVEIFLASLSAALVCGGGNAVNDYLDIESDRLNHPNRPFPKGDLPPYLAILTASIFNIAAIIIAATINSAILTIVVGSIILLTAYNFRLKKLPLMGNLIISILGGATFIVGGLAVDATSITMLPGPMVPALFAALFHLGREFIKDIADFEGDMKVDCKTLLSVLSQNSIMIILSVLYAILIILTLVPVYLDWYRPMYGYIALLLVDIPIIIILTYLWFSRSKARFSKGGSVLKLLMLFGLFAFLLGKNY